MDDIKLSFRLRAYKSIIAPLTNVQKRLLRDQHSVQIQEYIDDNTYMCRYEPTDLESLRQLPFIRTANCLHTRLKPEASLKSLIKDEPRDARYVCFQFPKRELLTGVIQGHRRCHLTKASRRQHGKCGLKARTTGKR